MTVKAVTNKNSKLKGALAILKIKKQGKRRGNGITHYDKCTSSLLHSRKSHGASFIGWKKDFIRR
ncbi:hypothetical protein ACPW99_11175 [Klebsiella pneumoniae]|jgi:hypothetical protein|uniref:Uncharacterized protein n=1 Tax=Klebsiella pneumoniae TaxID=573 RepID=A0A5D3JN68_KLEPN|nr:hypothetical protein [Klebsiella pneumoniae]EIV5405707.1 hypothetical protein [Klebsiella pneumoniae]EIW9303969.1 hypothetical protein [Klebsiella pneumoniae]EIX9185465.1 hypothetical protein [Klebsiella pneumoniae]EIX9337272.1 hypothetical protein [Klebsiella pneumoniae]EIX9800953.1 hypothetical protein [Klebsiella pneumoniae]